MRSFVLPDGPVAAGTALRAAAKRTALQARVGMACLWWASPCPGKGGGENDPAGIPSSTAFNKRCGGTQLRNFRGQAVICHFCNSFW